MLEDYATSLERIFCEGFYSYSPDEIKEIRKNLGLSHEAFAHLFFADKSTSVKWESGDRTPSCSSMRLMQFVEMMATRKKTDMNHRIRQAYKRKY